MKYTEQDIARIIQDLKGFDPTEASLSISKLFSGTNFISIVEAPGIFKAIFREFGESPLINRQREALTFKLASDSGLGPKILQSQADYRIEEFITGKTLQRLECGNHIASISRSLAQFHQMAEVGPENIITEYIQSWRAKLLNNLSDFSIDSEKKLELISLVQEHYEEALKIVVNDSQEFVLSHNDFSYGNLIVQDQEILILDYEYAGPGHPSIDLASLIVETMFDFSQPEYQYLPQDELSLAHQELLVSSYSQARKMKAEVLWGQVARSKAVVCYLGALWAGCNYNDTKASMLDYALIRMQLFLKYKSELS